MAYGPNGYIRVPTAEDRLRDTLYEMAAARRPSVAALKRTGCCFHPSRVG